MLRIEEQIGQEEIKRFTAELRAALRNSNFDNVYRLWEPSNPLKAYFCGYTIPVGTTLQRSDPVLVAAFIIYCLRSPTTTPEQLIFDFVMSHLKSHKHINFLFSNISMIEATKFSLWGEALGRAQADSQFLYLLLKTPEDVRNQTHYQCSNSEFQLLSHYLDLYDTGLTPYAFDANTGVVSVWVNHQQYSSWWNTVEGMKEILRRNVEGQELDLTIFKNLPTPAEAAANEIHLSRREMEVLGRNLDKIGAREFISLNESLYRSTPFALKVDPLLYKQWWEQHCPPSILANQTQILQSDARRFFPQPPPPPEEDAAKAAPTKKSP